MVTNYEFVTLKFVLINEEESNRRKLPKVFVVKNLRMTPKKLILIKKRLTRCVKNGCVRGC